jgi:hypothetical protein
MTPRPRGREAKNNGDLLVTVDANGVAGTRDDPGRAFIAVLADFDVEILASIVVDLNATADFRRLTANDRQQLPSRTIEREVRARNDPGNASIIAERPNQNGSIECPGWFPLDALESDNSGANPEWISTPGSLHGISPFY